MKFKDEHVIKMINSQDNTLSDGFVHQNWPCSISMKNILRLFMCILHIFISRSKVEFCEKLREITYK